MNETGTVRPTEVRLHRDRMAVSVTFDNGEVFDFPAEFLRVLSPSAEVKGHSSNQRQTVGGKRKVKVSAIHPVGNYAVRLVFDDRHETGIYSWDFFLDAGRRQQALWQGYLGELAAKGLTRDPP